MGIESDLQQLQQRAANLQGMLQGLESAAPDRAEGADRARAVQMVLGPDGMPESIKIDAMWRDRISPEALGPAVAEAFQQASQRRGEEWAAALEQQGQGSPPATAPAPEPAPAPAAPVQRSLSALTEEAITLMDQARTAPPPARQARGDDPDGRLTITLTRSGQITCSVDAEWAGRQQSTQLNRSFRSALDAAREELERSERRAAEDAPSPARMAQLFADSLALINQPTQP